MATPERILVVVDVQRDFFDPSGALYVKGSEELPELIKAKFNDYDGVIFTLDWHPGNHCSFSEQGGIWPAHCVAYTQGAGLPDSFSEVLASGRALLFFKGKDQAREQYGAFEALRKGTKVRQWLEGCRSIDVCGIAGDYCVKESTANILRYAPASKVGILTDCIRSIDGGTALEAFITEKKLIRK